MTAFLLSFLSDCVHHPQNITNSHGHARPQCLNTRARKTFDGNASQLSPQLAAFCSKECVFSLPPRTLPAPCGVVSTQTETVVVQVHQTAG